MRSKNRRRADQLVLLVDDDCMDRRFFEVEAETFRSVTIVQVDHGEEALEWLDNNQLKTPNLIVLDHKMPPMDGLQALIEMRKNPRLKYVPIVGITMDAPDSQIMAYLNAGANAYYYKPHDSMDAGQIYGGILSHWLFNAVFPERFQSEDLSQSLMTDVSD